MRETIRDFTLAVAALAALFAAFQSWTTERELAAFREEVAAEFAAVREEMAAEFATVREELAEVRGQLQTLTDIVLAHVNAPGLHRGAD
jgi:hypothetical protein